MMLAAVRSELVRLRRPGYLIGWFGLTALFTIMVNSVLYSTATSGFALPEGAPGVSFPTLAELSSADGLMIGLSTAASMFGVVTLSFWAIAVASDYSTGLVRLLVSAVPQRWPLLLGKVVALALLTGVATTVATIVNLTVASAAAQAAGIDTALWADAAVGTVLSAWLSTYAALLVWGVIGLAIAYAARSAAIAISIGVGYVLVVEPMVGRLFDGDTSWLLGTTLSDLAGGGTGAVLLWAAGYVVVGLGIATAVLMRRDVTD